MTGISLVRRTPPERRPALVDERGSLTWRRARPRSDALAVGLAAAPGGQPATVGILCRNHRGFVEALAAAAGSAPTRCCSTPASPARSSATCSTASSATILIYDEEFADLSSRPGRRSTTWSRCGLGTEGATAGATTLDELIDDHRGKRPAEAGSPGGSVLLTSGTTGTPKGARRPAAVAGALASMFDRIPWRAEQTTVVAAPMFHAWGFGQLAISATLALHGRDAAPLRPRGDAGARRRAPARPGSRSSR